MQNLTKPSDNLGGVLRLWAIPPSDIVSLSAGVLTLSPTENLISLYLTPESAESRCLVKRASGGIYYEISVAGFTPMIRGEAEELFGRMAGHDFVVVFLDGNQQYQVAGTANEPLHFSWEAATGMAVSDRNGYDISFRRDCIRPIVQTSNPF